MRRHPGTTTVATTVAHPDYLALPEDLKATVAGLFKRREPRGTLWDLVTGLLMELPRPNRWPIGEAVGHQSPCRLQHLPSRAVWDADAVLAAVAGWVTTRLTEHVAGPVVLAVDETGDRSPPPTPSGRPSSTAAPWAGSDCARSPVICRWSRRPGTR